MTDLILLTPVEAARVLGIGRSKLYGLLRLGALRSVRIGACRRIPVDALTDWVPTSAVGRRAGVRPGIGVE